MQQHLVLLQHANSEIRSLRKQNELMSARLNMFDNMMLLLNTTPNRGGQGMSPDLCFEIDTFIKDEQAKETN